MGGARTVPKKNTKKSPKIFGALGTSQVPVRSRKKILKIPPKYWGSWGPPRCPYGLEKNTKKSPKLFGALGTSQVPVRSRKKNTKNSPKIFGALGTSQVPVRFRKKK